MADLGTPLRVDPRLLEYAEHPLKLAHAIAGIVKFIDLQIPAKRAEIARACAVLGVTVPTKAVRRG